MGLFSKKKPKTRVTFHHVSFHVILGLGRFDSINKIFFDDKQAWGEGLKYWISKSAPLPNGTKETGKERDTNIGKRFGLQIKEREVETNVNVFQNQEININKRDLFGGDKNEGGVGGNIDVMFGESNQQMNPHIAKVIAGDKAENTPTYRGVTSLLFKSFYFGTSMYMKALSVIATRRNRTYYNQEQWYIEKVAIGQDMNPIHIIREVLTCSDPQWGMNISPNQIDEDSFKNAADKLYEEKLGLSFLWDKSGSASSFLQDIYKHINCFLIRDRKTNKYKIRLVRPDYSFDKLRILNENEIASIVKYTKSEAHDLYNQLTIKYWDRERRKQGAITGSNTALYDLVGIVNAETITYQGCCTEELANRLLARDLQTLCTPLASLTIKATRECFDLELGDVLRVQLKDDNVPDVAYRIIEQKYDEAANYTEIKLMQDIFGYPKSINANSNKFDTNIIGKPLPAKNIKLFELSKLDIFKVYGIEISNRITQSETAYGIFVERAGTESSYEVVRLVAGQYLNQGSGDFNKTSLLIEDINYIDLKIKVPTISVFDIGDTILINNERLYITGAENDTTLIVKRGVEDTQISKHKAGDLIYFVENYFTSNDLINTSKQYLKILPSNSIETLDMNKAVENTIDLIGRHVYPYPPQNIKINNEYFPQSVEIKNDDKGDFIEISCCGRDVDLLEQIHWFSNSYSRNSTIKTYLSINNVVDKLEIKHNNTNNRIDVKDKTSLNKAVVKVWSEVSDLQCLQPFIFEINIK